MLQKAKLENCLFDCSKFEIYLHFVIVRLGKQGFGQSLMNFAWACVGKGEEKIGVRWRNFESTPNLFLVTSFSFYCEK